MRRRKVDDLANASSDAVAAGESFQETYRDRRAPGRQVVLSKAAGAGLVRVEPPRMHESTVRESPVRGGAHPVRAVVVGSLLSAGPRLDHRQARDLLLLGAKELLDRPRPLSSEPLRPGPGPLKASAAAWTSVTHCFSSALSRPGFSAPCDS